MINWHNTLDIQTPVGCQQDARYIVIKITDAESYLCDIEKDRLASICSSINRGRAAFNKQELEIYCRQSWRDSVECWKKGLVYKKLRD